MHLTHPGITQIRSPLIHFVKYQGGKQRQMNKKTTEIKLLNVCDSPQIVKYNKFA